MNYKVIAGVTQGKIKEGKMYYATERIIDDDTKNLIEISDDKYTYGLFNKDKFIKVEIKLATVENDVIHFENGLVL